MTDPLSIARTYAKSAISGRGVTAGRWIKAAAERFLNDLKASRERNSTYVYSRDQADAAVNFIQLLPHIKGEFARRNESLILEPWQVFITCNIFGFVRRADETRRYRRALITVSRKNGKSSYASAVGLYMLCADEEAGPEIYALATTRDQAGIVFSDARAMVRKSPKLAEYYGVEAGALAIFRNSAHGTFKPLPGDPGDGTNPHCAIIDEYHEHQSPRAYDAMYSGMGARRQPLILVTTTAGYNRAGPCYQMEAYSKKVLNGDIDDPSLFAALYTLDDGDQWTDSRVWAKANPNLGVSVSRDNLEEACFEAQNNSVKQVNFLTKRMNIWVSSGVQWFDIRDWNACADQKLTLDAFAGYQAYIGLDLASKIDLCALEILIKDGDRFVRFGKYYLPEEPVTTGSSSTHAHYYAWSLDGYLTLTPGNITDYRFIINDLMDVCQKLDVISISYDPFQATQLATQLLEIGLPMIETRMTVLGLSSPMKELQAMIKSSRIAHDGCPVMSWQMGNVVAHTDNKDNVFPRKQTPDDKIDSVVALIMAVSRAMLGEQPSAESKYNEQPLVVL